MQLDFDFNRIQEQYVRTVCSLLEPYIDHQCTPYDAYLILALVLVSAAIIYWLFVHQLTVRIVASCHRTLVSKAKNILSTIRVKIRVLKERIVAYVQSEIKKASVPVDIDEGHIEQYRASIREAQNKQYENLVNLLELALRNEAVQVTKELLMLKEEAQTFGGQTAQIPIQTTQTSQIPTQTNIQQTSTYDILMEQILENCVNRIKLRFDQNSWKILSLAYGSEHNLVQYIKDRIIDYILGTVNTPLFKE